MQPPQPTNARVTLEAAGGEILAAMRFEGSATPAAAEAARTRLIAALTKGELFHLLATSWQVSCALWLQQMQCELTLSLSG